jgi:hypothetical protein
MKETTKEAKLLSEIQGLRAFFDERARTPLLTEEEGIDLDEKPVQAAVNKRE